jgi:lipopolysaccharide/colanic/teichoic acid biosynthesis glycosyltransferase
MSLEAGVTRAFDIAVSATALIVLAPLMALLGLLTRVSSRGPVLFRAERVGKDGRTFRLYKFRTMRAGSEAGPALTREGDPRVTRVGRFLRRYRLDELPQLWNVVRGEMSLVGPRPEDPRYVARYTPEQRQVLLARPGMTGAAALEYLNEHSLLTGPDWEERYVRFILPEKLRIELDYLRRRSFASDLRVLVRTVRQLLRRPMSPPAPKTGATADPR